MKLFRDFMIDDLVIRHSSYRGQSVPGGYINFMDPFAILNFKF